MVVVLVQIGPFKGVGLLGQSPVDLTVGAALITAVTLALSQRTIPPSVHLAIALLAVLFVAFTAGVYPVLASNYAQSKITLLFTLIPFIVIVGVLGSSSGVQFFRAIILTQICLTLTMVVLMQGARVASIGEARLVLEGSNTIGASRVFGAGAVVLVVLSMRSKRWLLVSLVPLLIIGWTMIEIGSRGPLYFVFLALLVASLAVGEKVRTRLAMFAVICASAAATYAFVRGQTANSFSASRLVAPITSAESDASSTVRTYLLSQAAEISFMHPLGVGWGRFSEAAQANGLPSAFFHAYPHNVLAEVFAESGWLSGLGFAGVILLALIGGYRARRESVWHLSLFSLHLYFIANAMVSGDVTSNRQLWLTTGLGLGMWAQQKWRRDAAGGRRSLSAAVSSPPT